MQLKKGHLSIWVRTWITCLRESTRLRPFYLQLSNIPVCLQPCGSDMIRRCEAGSNAMIWRRRGRRREQVRARKSLFLFIVKISFPTAQTLPEGPKQLVFKQTGCHRSTLTESRPFMSSLSAVLKGEAHVLHVLLASWQSALFPQLQRIVGFTSIKIFQSSKATKLRFQFIKL